MMEIIITILVIIGLAALLIIFGNVTPNVFAWYLRRSPMLNHKIMEPGFAKILEGRIRIQRDIEYTSAYLNNTMDIYAPVNAPGRLPTLFWLHGGAFVAGDKAGVSAFAKALAAEGYTVIPVNYALAPKATYPAAIVQMIEAYQYVQANLKQFPTVDISNLAFGGDSAGAQIISQFLAVQTNPILAREMGVEAIVPRKSIKAAVLYCGPYNMSKFTNISNRRLRHLVHQLGCAYFGRKDWQSGNIADQVSTYDQVTANYPDTFLTDGNSGSFEAQAKELAMKLKSLQVPVGVLFYPVEAGAVPHEYQFAYDQFACQAQECFLRTRDFLNARMK